MGSFGQVSRRLALLAIVVAVVSCATASPPPNVTPTNATSSPSPVVSPQATIPADAAAAVTAAQQDLATRAKVQPNQINVISVTSATWPDGALGCPKPGQLYSQIVTPGYKILLSANGQTYEYHSGRGPQITYCSGP